MTSEKRLVGGESVSHIIGKKSVAVRETSKYKIGSMSAVVKK